MATREELKTSLQAHDWYYGYSDDHRYWSAGQNQKARIQALFNVLSPPFELMQLRAWALRLVQGELVQGIDGHWRKGNSASVSTAETITAQMAGEIELGGTAKS